MQGRHAALLASEYQRAAIRLSTFAHCVLARRDDHYRALNGVDHAARRAVCNDCHILESIRKSNAS